MSEVTKPIALDESFNTTGQTPKNIADVIKNGLQEVAQAIDSHQGGGGHVILDQNGNALDQEPNMQFVDAHTSDDSVNTKTVIENIKSVTEAQFESATEDGLYDVDVEGAEIGEISEEYVEVTVDGNVSYTTLFNNIYSQAIDTSKLTNDSVLVLEQPNGSKSYAHISKLYSNAIIFSEISEYAASTLYSKVFKIASSGSFMVDRANTTDTVYESQLVPQGTKFTLYYGNDKAVVDLQTTANRCLMSDGETVEDAISGYVVAEASANQTFASQLGTLYTKYNSLSDSLKRRCNILLKTSATEIVIPVSIIADGSGTATTISSTSQTTNMMNMKFSLYRVSTITTNSSFSIADNSSTTNSYELKLFVR